MKARTQKTSITEEDEGEETVESGDGSGSDCAKLWTSGAEQWTCYKLGFSWRIVNRIGLSRFSADTFGCSWLLIGSIWADYFVCEINT